MQVGEGGMRLASVWLACWQPIETAPIEEDVLVYFNNRQIGVMKLTDEGILAKPEWTGTHTGSKLPELGAITHWMPLPEPPCAPETEALNPTEQKRPIP